MLARDAIGKAPRRLILPALAFIGLAGLTLGGPAKYDASTRSFSLTYTYASLPAYQMSPDEVESLGSLQSPSPEQDAKFRGVQQAVSQILFQITDGRAKIGSLEYVDSIKKADIVVSLTGTPDRGGFSQLGAIEGRPGQIVLYYQLLAAEDNQGMINTVAHELCHYLFALPDEYSNGTECPLSNPDGPGCLMDNYFNRHGFLELCRDPTHNASAPFQGTVILPHKASDSCKFWVEQFFDAHPPGPASSSDPGTPSSGDTGATGETLVTAEEPFTGIFKLLVDSATLFVKDELGKADGTSRPSTTSATSKARTLADKFLKEQIPQATTLPGFLKPTDTQRKQALDLIVKRATSGRVKPPASFNPKVIEQLKTKAQELAVSHTGQRPAGSLIKLLLTGQTDNDKLKKLQPIIALVRKGLIAYLTKGLIPGFAPSASGSSTRLSEEEKKFVDQVAREAVLGSSTASKMSVFQEAALLHIRLSLNTEETLNAIASELNLPGARNRNTSLRSLEDQLKSALKGYALPGRPFNGFGYRRTYVVAPRPQDPANDFVDIDAGDHIAYEEVRDLAVGEITRLLRRERVEYLDDAPGAVANVKPTALAGPRTAAARRSMATVKPGDRFANQVNLINQLIDAVRRNRVENIIIFAPPGGLSQELGEVLEQLRIEIVGNPYSDVRIDLILWDIGNVPLRTRDLIARTGGIVQTVGDVDEIGAVAQRIENDLAAGSWVKAPEQGMINLSLATESAGHAKDRPVGQVTLDLDAIRKRFNGDPKKAPPDVKSEKKAPPADKADEKDDQQVGTFQPTIPGTFELSNNEIQQLNYRLGLVIENLVRVAGKPDEFNQVGNVIAGLSTIQGNFEDVRNRLNALKVGDKDHPFHPALHDLLDRIGETKLLVRSTLGQNDPSITPLNDTDDHFEWLVHRTLTEEAHQLRGKLEELGKPGRLSKRALAGRLNKVSYFLQRATERDQRLTDLRRNIYSKEFELFTRPTLRDVPDKINVIQEYTKAVRPLRAEADRLEQAAGYRTHRLACLLLDAARVRGEQVAAEQAANEPLLESLAWVEADPGGAAARSIVRRFLSEVTGIVMNQPGPAEAAAQTQMEVKTRIWRDRHAVLRSLMVRLLNLEAAGRLLDVASRQPINLDDLRTEVDSLGVLIGSLKNDVKSAGPRIGLDLSRPDPQDAPDIPDPIKNQFPNSVSPRDLLREVIERLEVLDELSVGLKQRVDSVQDHLASGIGAETPPCDETDTPAALIENALTPLKNSLKFDNDLTKAARGMRYPSRKPDGGEVLDAAEVQRWLGITPEDGNEVVVEVIKLRVDELIYGDFPLLMLDLLGRLRMLESELNALDKSLDVQGEPTPVFRRMKERRPIAEAKTSPDGKTIDIKFQPFQAEAGAKIELVLGFSRPLRNFEGLKKSPPILRFLKDGNLVEKPYLGFEADLSTDTMLVWTIPKPELQVGNIGVGVFTPQITFPVANLPVTGRDNTLDYTFSVGTPRPNVQLITALRQPQPTVGGRDRSKDLEEAYRGTLAADQLDAVVEVQVVSGSSIKAAHVTGAFQRFDLTNEAIETPTLTFLDDGKFPDLQKDDGIYTLSIPLMPNTRRKPGEYRIFIQAKSQEGTEFLPVSEPIPVNPETDDKDNNGVLDPDKDKTNQLPKIPPFQRSSSLNFHVSGES